MAKKIEVTRRQESKGFKMLAHIKNDFDFHLFIANEDNCRTYLKYLRWDGSPPWCPYCKNKVYEFKDGKRYKCKSCHRIISLTTGTIFENSTLPLQKWFYAIFIYAGMCESYPANKLKNRLGVSYKTALFVHHRIMELFKVDYDGVLKTNSKFEVDVVGIGPEGRSMNKRAKKRMYQKRGVKGTRGHGHRISILGYLDRKKYLYAFAAAPYINTAYILTGAHIVALPQSTFYADSARENLALENNFSEVHIVNHNKHDYGYKDKTTNNIERAFKSFKDGFRRYVRVKEEYIQRYANEQAFFYSMKSLQKLTEIECFDEAFKNINRKISFNSLQLEGFCYEIVLGQNRNNNDKRVLKKYFVTNRFKVFISKSAKLDSDNLLTTTDKQEKFLKLLFPVFGKTLNWPNNLEP